MDFPGSAVDRNLPTSAGDKGSIPGSERPHIPWDNWACAPWLLNQRAIEPMLHSGRIEVKSLSSVQLFATLGL